MRGNIRQANQRKSRSARPTPRPPPPPGIPDDWMKRTWASIRRIFKYPRRRRKVRSRPSDFDARKTSSAPTDSSDLHEPKQPAGDRPKQGHAPLSSCGDWPCRPTDRKQASSSQAPLGDHRVLRKTLAIRLAEKTDVDGHVTRAVALERNEPARTTGKIPTGGPAPVGSPMPGIDDLVRDSRFSVPRSGSQFTARLVLRTGCTRERRLFESLSPNGVNASHGHVSV